MQVSVAQKRCSSIKRPFSVGPAPGVLKRLTHAGHGQSKEEERKQHETQHGPDSDEGVAALNYPAVERFKYVLLSIKFQQLLSIGCFCTAFIPI